MLLRKITFVMLGKFVISVVRSLICGKDILAPELIRMKRLSKCLVCEHYREGQCELCTCFVEMKVCFSDEKCPHVPPKWNSFN